ncbi:hypothetical protein EIP86_006675 [Pleurotus ostreatoroseus]|nr:hypothetical protein EIP86_006675 [Pleurotus ostreatoroseus]
MVWNQAFKLTLRSHGGPDVMFACAVYVDGALADKYLLKTASDKVVEGIRVSEGKVRPFIFSNVRLTAMLQAQGLISIKEDVSKTPRRKRLNGEEAGPIKRPRTDDGKGYGVKSSEKDLNVKGEDKDEELMSLLTQRDALNAMIQQAEAQRIKREREPSPIILKAGPHEVIDLTDE